MNKKSLLSLCLSAGILTGVPAFTFASEATASGNPPASATALPVAAEPDLASATMGPAAKKVSAATSDSAIMTATGISNSTATAKTPETKGSGKAAGVAEAAAGDVSEKTGEKVISNSEVADSDSADADAETNVDSEAAIVDSSSEADTDPALTDTDSETDPDADLSSDADVTPEKTATATPEVYDPFAADPFTGSPLLRMKRRLETLAGINGRMQKSADLALAVAVSASEDRYFRRNCEYLTRLIRRSPFPALASTLVFPEFLGIANELMLESTRAIINISIEDLQHNPQKRLKMLNELNSLHQLTGQIAQMQRKALQNVKDIAASLTYQARRRSVGAPPADMLKKIISEVSQLLDQSAGRWEALLNQHDHHRAHFSGILDYLVSSNDSLPAVRHAAQLSQMLRSLLDFKISLEDFYGHVSASPARLGDRQQALAEKLASLASRSNQFRSRVAAFDGRFPARENDPAATPAFSCAEELTEIFSLLEKMQVAKIVTGLAKADTAQQPEISTVIASGSDIVVSTDSSEPEVTKKPTAQKNSPKPAAIKPANGSEKVITAAKPKPTDKSEAAVTSSENKPTDESYPTSEKEKPASSELSETITEEPAVNEPEIRKTLLEELVAWVNGSPWPIPVEKNADDNEDKNDKDKNANSEEIDKADLTPDSASVK